MKDHIRDYATAAFKFYASIGMSAEQYKKIIYDEALENYQRKQKGTGISFPTEAAIMAAEREVCQKLSEIMDMEAVEKTLAELRAMHRKDIVQAIEYVYFKEPQKEFEKGDIHNRVHEAELSIPASERAIYKWLGRARKMFAEKRNLRVE